MSRIHLIVCFIQVIFLCESARILVVVPIPSVSHQVVFRPLTQELAKRGHEVIYATTDPAFPKGQTPPNLTEIDFHDFSYKIWEENMMNLDRGNKNGHMELMRLAFEIISKVFEEQLRHPEIQALINDRTKKVDLLILEACSRPALALSHVFKAPVILMSSLGAINNNYELVGAPTHPLLYPTPLRQRVYNLTLLEKISELYNHYQIKKMFIDNEDVENRAIRRVLGPQFPPLSDLYNNVDMLFLNIHPIFEGNFPVPPNVIYIWGIHSKPKKELPQDLKSYLDSSKQGVIYMSFGTNTDPTILPPERIQMFVNVFSKLPYNVLWKWNSGELPGRSNNVKIGKWFPQSDLLRHPNIKLFITQGGIQSTDETIKARVPIVGVPMLGDQWYNVEKCVHLGIGAKLDWDTITEEQISNAIKTVIEDDSYRRNIAKIDELMRDQPQSPLERAVWWTEHVLRHGGARHLRAPAANISWAEYLELDLVLTLVVVILGILSFTIILMYYLYKFLSRISLKFKVKTN